MRRLICYSLIFLLPACLYAQLDGKQYNSLLWRITGNGLTKPSYLYGTMHLTDKRVFYFGDSVYNALEHCEGFAAELDMSTFATQYINAVLSGDDEEETPSLASALDEKKLEQYKSKLEKRFGKPIEKITAKDIESASEDQTNRILAKGEMKTFMDAYLFDIAFKQGKWTGGIEDIEDQLEHKAESIEEKLEAMFAPAEKTDKTIEWMIKVYLKQDLDLIDRTDAIWRGNKDRILLKRNGKMSWRIDSLAHIRSCLFAIGAAHLPGDSGVVSLLRKRGFIVTAVTSSQKIAPEKYTFKTVERPWVEVDPKDSLYSLQMPGKAEVFKVFEDMPFEMKMFFDMGSLMVYMTLNAPANAATTAEKDSLLAKMVRRYKTKNLGVKEKDIMMGTEKGKEITMKNDVGEFRMQAFVPGSFVVINLVFATKKETLGVSDAERFFQSFRPNKKSTASTADATGKWETYAFPQHAFSVSLPAKYRAKKKEEEEEGWNEKGYEVYDISGNAYYGIFVGENKHGYYSSEDSAYFDRVSSSLETNMEGTNISSRHFLVDGYPAFESVMKAGKEYDNAYMKIFLLNRGNRKYFLLATYEEGKSAPVDRFFSTFALLPIPELKWRQETAPDNSFRVWSPSAVRIETDTTDLSLKYSLYDSVSPVSVHIDKDVISPYYWAANDSLVYNRWIKTFIGYNDSLMEYKKVKNGNIKGVDIVIGLGGSHNLKKMRMFLNADTIYTIYSFMPRELLEKSDYKKLFDDFRVTREMPATDFSQRKPAALLAALRSRDSVEFAKAKEAFQQVIFDEADLPLLQEALLYQYQDFDSSYYTRSTINGALTTLIVDMDSNYNTVSFIKNNYDKVLPEHEFVKPYLLSLLGQMQTKASYELLKEIVVKKPPRIDHDYFFSHSLYDSLDLSRSLYPEILSRADAPGLSWVINGLATSLLDSGLLTRKDILPYKDVFIGLARKELLKDKKVLEENAYDFYELIQLLQVLNLPEANAELNRFGKVNDQGLRMKVIVALLKNNQPVDRKDINTLAAADEFRSELYTELKQLNKLSLFPVNYLSQKHLGQSEVFNYATDDYKPESVSYLGERTVVFKGKKQKFYLYKVVFGDGADETYLGVAGPYSLDPKDYNTSHDATGLIYDENYNAEKIYEFFKKYLSELEEEEESEKK